MTTAPPPWRATAIANMSKNTSLLNPFGCHASDDSANEIANLQSESNHSAPKNSDVASQISDALDISNLREGKG